MTLAVNSNNNYSHPFYTELFRKETEVHGRKCTDKKILGYARVSSYEQNEDRQVIALREMGVPEKQIYIDRQSGQDFNRPQYQRLMRRLDGNCVLFVKSIDRLGRNYVDLNEQWRC